jgi:hypothetical protein
MDKLLKKYIIYYIMKYFNNIINFIKKKFRKYKILDNDIMDNDIMDNECHNVINNTCEVDIDINILKHKLHDNIQKNINHNIHPLISLNIPNIMDNECSLKTLYECHNIINNACEVSKRLYTHLCTNEKDLQKIGILKSKLIFNYTINDNITDIKCYQKIKTYKKPPSMYEKYYKPRSQPYKGQWINMTYGYYYTHHF